MILLEQNKKDESQGKKCHLPGLWIKPTDPVGLIKVCLFATESKKTGFLFLSCDFFFENQGEKKSHESYDEQNTQWRAKKKHPTCVT